MLSLTRSGNQHLPLRSPRSALSERMLSIIQITPTVVAFRPAPLSGRPASSYPNATAVYKYLVKSANCSTLFHIKHFDEFVAVAAYIPIVR